MEGGNNFLFQRPVSGPLWLSLYGRLKREEEVEGKTQEKGVAACGQINLGCFFFFFFWAATGFIRESGFGSFFRIRAGWQGEAAMRFSGNGFGEERQGLLSGFGPKRREGRRLGFFGRGGVSGRQAQEMGFSRGAASRKKSLGLGVFFFVHFLFPKIPL